jgi:molecular chaperone GrpE
MSRKPPADASTQAPRESATDQAHSENAPLEDPQGRSSDFNQSSTDALHHGGRELGAELAECQDRLLRLQAEMENVRRRTAREVVEERRYAAMPLVRDLLQVLDNVDRALEAGEKASDAAALLEGFQLVGRQLRSTLEKHDIKPIPAEGEAFDPNLHEAILQQPSDQPSGTIVLVTQEGFQLHDRVVRPSQVIVSSGGR